ncbi:hypothetical protein KAFR_0A00610 [Kazachstania africana CBS 2517]|uniref:Alkyl transferase n=1 Tax=Kazachstania africana (strain ATCC 22294 / BCRC 22015 / CBS 2517 / CECT 1963 / NBRC 1671 / NRRL Y-8276) TaxID=1071382 RepID=H2AM99_KAZAF|nr:hypothetical protein KAFR_0A00610 [Kazachstania africana CBS 2517]CCF55499.1 hypothetical protein KAFR_0A00610 [Kazachstania africana CBS 2517]
MLLMKLYNGPLLTAYEFAIELYESMRFHIALRTQKLRRSLKSNCVIKAINEMIEAVLTDIISVGPVPYHVSFIMDGNRRFAKSSNLSLQRGHEAGGLTLLHLVYICKKLGVKCVSAYAFSIENFNRPKKEVDTLMQLFSEKLDEFTTRSADPNSPLYGSCLKVVGDRDLLSDDIKKKVSRAEELTKSEKGFTLIVCFPYTSRNDIYHTIYSSISQVQNNKIKTDDITVRTFTESMYLKEYADKCDILIRTSGQKRLSDYMLWQSHENSTIEFCDTLWPDFTFSMIYTLMLRWSYFTTIQNYNRVQFSLRQELSNKLKIFNRKKKIPIESFPEPPVAVTVSGKE